MAEIRNPEAMELIKAAALLTAGVMAGDGMTVVRGNLTPEIRFQKALGLVTHAYNTLVDGPGSGA